jgi:hypothetical protein
MLFSLAGAGRSGGAGRVTTFVTKGDVSFDPLQKNKRGK